MPIYDDEILEKGTNETLVLGINFSNWLGDSTISTINSLTSDKNDITLSSEEISGSSVSFIASGGSAGMYVITCNITTSDSQIFEVSVKLRVR